MIKFGWDGPQLRFQVDFRFYILELLGSLGMLLMAGCILVGALHSKPSPHQLETRYIIKMHPTYMHKALAIQRKLDAERTCDDETLMLWAEDCVKSEIWATLLEHNLGVESVSAIRSDTNLDK